MAVRRRKHDLVAILATTSAVIFTLSIALTSPRPLKFRMMSGVVIQGDHGLNFASDDFRIDWIAGKQFGVVGTPCSKNWAAAGRGSDSWGFKMHWRFEGAEIPRSTKKARNTNALPCTIEVKRIIELHVLE